LLVAAVAVVDLVQPCLAVVVVLADLWPVQGLLEKRRMPSRLAQAAQVQQTMHKSVNKAPHLVLSKLLTAVVAAVVRQAVGKTVQAVAVLGVWVLVVLAFLVKATQAEQVIPQTRQVAAVVVVLVEQVAILRQPPLVLLVAQQAQTITTG